MKNNDQSELSTQKDFSPKESNPEATSQTEQAVASSEQTLLNQSFNNVSAVSKELLFRYPTNDFSRKYITIEVRNTGSQDIWVNFLDSDPAIGSNNLRPSLSVSPQSSKQVLLNAEECAVEAITNNYTNRLVFLYITDKINLDKFSCSVKAIFHVE